MRAAWLPIHLYCTQVFDKESFLVLCLPPESFPRNPGEKMHVQAYYRNEKVIVAEWWNSLLVIDIEHGRSSGNYSGWLFLLIAGINIRNEGESHGNVAFAVRMRGWVMGKDLEKKPVRLLFPYVISQKMSWIVNFGEKMSLNPFSFSITPVCFELLKIWVFFPVIWLDIMQSF